MDAFEWDTALVDPEKGHDESRWTATGFIGPVLHVVAFTERSETVRIISLRKATKRDAHRYVEDQA